jgi:nitrogen-specific signal transduction histidine kinase
MTLRVTYRQPAGSGATRWTEEIIIEEDERLSTLVSRLEQGANAAITQIIILRG